MVLKLEYFFILVIILCRFSLGFKCNAKPNLNPQFDTLLFAQQWPLTYCHSLKNDGRECKISTGIWTIHGIWPSRFYTNVADQPSCCDSAIHLDENGLQPIKENLKRYWPTYRTDQSDESFWEYEWLKHGTCGVSIDGLDSSPKYFNRALHWLAEYNMTSILAKSNIMPDNERSYQLVDIHAAIRSVLNKKPSINCYIDGKSGKQFLSEIRLCFDPEFSIVDCDGINKGSNKDHINTNCSNKPIYYPDYVANDTTTWFTYVGYFCLAALVIVVGFLEIRRRFFGNHESTRLFNRRSQYSI